MTVPAASVPARATPAGTPVPDASAAQAGGSLRIGDLAARTGVSVNALRFCERPGRLRSTGRRAGGYREYPPEAAALVRFVKRAQALGFTLAEVEELVRLRADARRSTAALAAREVAAAKVRDVDYGVRQLLALRGALAGLGEACEAVCGPDGSADDAGCPIIGALDDEPLDDECATPAQALPVLGLYENAVPTSARGDDDDDR